MKPWSNWSNKATRWKYKPVVTGDDKRFYHVDGMPRTEDQILKWVVDGVRPGSDCD
jgi:hypothetical protein